MEKAQSWATLGEIIQVLKAAGLTTEIKGIEKELCRFVGRRGNGATIGFSLYGKCEHSGAYRYGEIVAPRMRLTASFESLIRVSLGFARHGYFKCYAEKTMETTSAMKKVMHWRLYALSRAAFEQRLAVCLDELDGIEGRDRFANDIAQEVSDIAGVEGLLEDQFSVIDTKTVFGRLSGRRLKLKKWVETWGAAPLDVKVVNVGDVALGPGLKCARLFRPGEDAICRLLNMGRMNGYDLRQRSAQERIANALNSCKDAPFRELRFDFEENDVLSVASSFPYVGRVTADQVREHLFDFLKISNDAMQELGGALAHETDRVLC